MGVFRSKIVVGIAALAVTLTWGTANALPINKCAAAKTKCVSGKVRGLLRCHAKAEGKGLALDSACTQRIIDKFTACIAKQEASPPCPTVDVATLENAIDAYVLDVVQELDPGYPIPVLNKCSACKKQRVSGKTTAKLGCLAKGFGRGIVEPTCLQKATDKFTVAFSQCEKKQPCLTTGDVAAIEAKVDAFVADMETAISVGIRCSGRGLELSTRDGTVTSIDLGWTGVGHDGASFATGAVLSGTLSSCEGTSPPCGTCQFTGPVQNASADAGQINNRRCTNNTRTQCTSSTDCGAGATCEFYVGSYVPVSSGFPLCVGNQVSGPFTGAVDLDSGDAAVAVALTTMFSLGLSPTQPCPTCVGDGAQNDGFREGTCQGGPNAGLSCDINGAGNRHLGSTSLDCPPAPGLPQANVVDATTGTIIKTLSAAHTGCSASPGKKCFCNTCNNATAVPCFTSAECPESPIGIPGVCGGKRCLNGTNIGAPCAAHSQCLGPGGFCGVPGALTRPNACLDDIDTTEIDESLCSTIGSDGECPGEPFDRHCSTAVFMDCSTDADCAAFGDTCVFTSRKCYADNGVIENSVTAVGTTAVPSSDQWDATLANQFVCVGPSHITAFDTGAGLPGLSRLELPVHLRVLP